MRKLILKENPLVTDLVNEKTTKLDSRVIFFGNCDELSCHIMEVRSIVKDDDLKEELMIIASKLSTIMGEVANGKTKLTFEDLSNIIDLVNKYEKNNGVITKFVLPGQTQDSARIHIARCVARRCELSYAKVYSEYDGSKIIFEYLNKLSTLLYAIALKYDI